MTGARPLGWYTGRSSINTLRLVMEAGGFLYSCNSYADDLPYWVKARGGTASGHSLQLDANDMRFVNAQGFGGGDQFFTYLKDSFDVLYAEGATVAEDDVGGPALPGRRPAGPGGVADALSRLHRRP